MVRNLANRLDCKNTTTKGLRNLNIEGLRVLAMLLIIVRHTLGHSGAVKEASGFMRYLVSAVYVLALPAVNVYVLISGFFLVDAKWNLKRIVLLWLQVFFYSALFYLIAVTTGLVPFSLSGLVKALLPISGNQYWFARVFWCFSLFAPFEAILLRNLSKRQFQFLLAVVLIIFSLWRNFVPFAVTVNAEGGNSILWFFVLFAFAAYLKRYANEKHGVKFYALLSIGAFLLSLTSYIALNWVSNRFGLNGAGSSLFIEYTSITMIALSVGLFMLFVRMPEKPVSARTRKIVMLVSGTTYSVYLIHENIYVKQWLWEIIRPLTWLDSNYFFLCVAAVALGIFVVSTVLDCITWKQIRKLIDKCDFASIQGKIDSIF